MINILTLMRSRRVKRSLLLIVPLLCLQNSSAQHELSRPQARELALECPADEFNDNGDSDESYEGRFEKYSKGSFGNSLVAKMRSKPESYYQKLVDNVVMVVCDIKTASERCVEKESAAKDWSGNCIKAADFVCPGGTCERASNCYWNSVSEGQNRTTRFEVNAYKNAATGKSIMCCLLVARDDD